MLSPRDRARRAWLAVSLSKPVRVPLTHSPPAAALVPEATAHLLVFEPIASARRSLAWRGRFQGEWFAQARSARLRALEQVLPVLLALRAVGMCLRPPWLNSSASNGSHSWRSNACFFGRKWYNYRTNHSCGNTLKFRRTFRESFLLRPCERTPRYDCFACSRRSRSRSSTPAS